MVLYREKLILGSRELLMEVHDGGRYALRYGDVLSYEDGKKRVRGRTSAYEFRSVEQLRYDFEKDLKQLG